MEDGSLKAIGKDAEKAAKSTDKATKSADKYSKKNKGVAGATSNSTKAFSKMTTGITDGLVPAYATLAANVFALTALFGVLSRNDAISKLQEGLEFTGRAGGRNLTLVADKLKEITDNAISAEQAMRTTAVGVSAGFSQQQMEGLAKVAKGAALALGRDMGDAMDRLTRGAAKLEPEILDELGIMVRLDDAVNNYAIAHNKATSELTQFERRMAFTNAIINDGISKYSALSESLDPSAYSQLSATFSDLTKSFVAGINSFFGPLLRFLAETPIALGALAAAFAAALSGQMMGGLAGIASASALAAQRTDEMSKASLKAIGPNKLLSKGYNKLARSFDGSRASIEKLIKRTDASLRQAKKGSASFKENTRQRKLLTKEIYLQDTAQSKHTASNALGMIQTHGLTAALKVQGVAYKELYTATVTATSGQSIFTKAAVIGRSAVTGLAMGVRFLGAAFLTIMPYVAMAMMAFSLLSPLLGKLFKDNTLLGKAVKENEKRFEEFQKVAQQYAKTIPHATSVTEAWLATLKPIAGLLTEVSTALDTAFNSANADRILLLAKAQEKANIAADYGANASTRNSAQMMMYARLVKIANKEIGEASQLSEEALRILQETAIDATSSVSTTFSQMSSAIDKETKAGRKALDIITKAQTTVDKAFDKFAKSNRGEEAYKELAKTIRTASESANSAVDSYSTFNETIRKAKELFGDPSKTTGEFAEEIDNLRGALIKINNVMAEQGPGSEMANDLLAAYGFKNGSLNNRLEELKELLKLMEDINESTKRQAREQQEIRIKEAQGFHNRLGLIQQEIDLITERQNTRGAYSLRQPIRSAAGAVRVGMDEEDILAGARDQASQDKLIRKKYNIAGDMAASTGSAGFAAMASGTGGLEASRTDEEEQLARVERARGVISGLGQDMMKLGPEGEAMGTALAGMVALADGWEAGMAVMKASTSDWMDKTSAGLGMAMGLVNQLGATYQAATKQKMMGIDQEIQAEKQRDGMSQASLNTIKKLEAKKEEYKRDAFEKDKKMKRAQTIMATAQGIMQAFQMGPIIGSIFAVAIAKMGADQLKIIDGMTYNGGGASGGAPEKLSVGARSNTVDLASGNNAGGELAYMQGAQGQGTGADNFTPAFAGYKHRAGGGYIVGEQGPEVFVPQTSGEIIPAGQEVGGTTNVNFSINAVDATGVEELLLNQQGNIIRMIRQAANEHGENFLENIDDAVYGEQ